jgi:hypothetical protein
VRPCLFSECGPDITRLKYFDSLRRVEFVKDVVSGVTVNSVVDNGELIMLSGFFGEDNEIRLLRRDGTIVKRWQLRYSEIFDDTSFLPSAPATD